MSYLRYWNLNRPPFSISRNRGGVYVGGSLEEAMARCEFLIDQNKELGLVIGPSGVGKTTLLEQLTWVRNSTQRSERLVRVDLRCVDADSFPVRIAYALDLDTQLNSSSHDAWQQIRDHLFSNAVVGHRTVLILDNVCGAPEDGLQNFLKVWGTNLRGSALMSVDDDDIVNLPRWILDQCELKIELPRWDLGQTADYFEFALVGAGGKDDLFDGQSITRIQELSDGIPRKICQLSDLTLVAGAVRKAVRVTAELVDEVSDEFTVPMGPKFPLFWEDQRLNAG